MKNLMRLPYSKSNQALVDEAPFGYVASLVPAHHRELLAIPVSPYRPLTGSRLGLIPGLRLTREIWGKQRMVLWFISEQRRGLQSSTWPSDCESWPSGKLNWPNPVRERAPEP